MTAVVRQLRRTTPVDVQPTAPPQAAADPETHDVLSGDCLCGRGPVIGTCIATSNRLYFRAFHESPVAYHLQRVTDWACVDCVADAALDVANGVVRERMRQMAVERAAEMDALMRANAMRREAGMPIVPGIFPEGCDEWPMGGER